MEEALKAIALGLGLILVGLIVATMFIVWVNIMIKYF